MTSGIGKFAKIADAFAAAAVDRSLWNEAMEVAAKATDSFGAIMIPVKGRLPNFPLTASMLPTAESYLQDGWIHRDERYRAMPAFSRRGAATEFDFTDSDEIARHPFYQDFLARFGLRWFAGVRVGAGDDVWCLSVQRSITQGPFAPSEVKDLAVLSGHLAGAGELARALAFARAEAAMQAFQISGAAVLMLDRRGEVVCANSSAERLVGGDLQIVRGRVTSFDRNATAALDRALHALIWSPESSALRPPVVLPRKLGRPILAYLVRASGTIREALGLCQAIVVLVDLESRLGPAQSDLIEAFRLTPAEARLAAQLAAGDSLDVTADKLGITYQTARNELRSIFGKTDTRRQAHLVAILSLFARRSNGVES
jgi:DNA-binding CsgD family transcriptional regulator